MDSIHEVTAKWIDQFTTRQQHSSERRYTVMTTPMVELTRHDGRDTKFLLRVKDIIRVEPLFRDSHAVVWTRDEKARTNSHQVTEDYTIVREMLGIASQPNPHGVVRAIHVPAFQGDEDE